MTFIHSMRIGAVAVAMGLAIAGGAHAQGHGGPGWGHGHDHMLFGMLDGVSLSDAQRDQVHGYIKAGLQSTKATREALHALDQQIDAMMLASGSVSSASLTSLAQQRTQLKAQLDQARISVALQVRSVLSATQLAQAAQTHSQLAALHQQEQAIVHPPGAASE